MTSEGGGVTGYRVLGVTALWPENLFADFDGSVTSVLVILYGLFRGRSGISMYGAYGQPFWKSWPSWWAGLESWGPGFSYLFFGVFWRMMGISGLGFGYICIVFYVD